MAEGARDVPDPTCATSRTSTRLLAVQGPRAIERLGLPGAAQFTFAEGEIDGIQCMVNRTGYTGEDGCELLAMAEDGAALWDRVLARGAVPCGLGARDTLRLEVCLPAARQRHHAGDGRDLRRPRLVLRARQGVHGCGRAARGQGARTRAQARPVRDGREGGSPSGHVGGGRRRGDVGHALADARPWHRPRLRAGACCRAGHRALDRRARAGALRARRQATRSTSERRVPSWPRRRPIRTT